MEGFSAQSLEFLNHHPPSFNSSTINSSTLQLLNSSTLNSYSVYVLTGLFTIYYYASTKEEGTIQCKGNIDFTLTSISMQINESTSLITDNWASADWQTPAAADVPASFLALQVVDTETWQERNAMGFSFDFGGEVTNLNGVLNDAEGDNLPCNDMSGRRTLFCQPSHHRQTTSPPTTRHSERTTRHSVQSTCRAVMPGERAYPSHSGHSGCSAVSGMFRRFGSFRIIRRYQMKSFF